ncbi:DNA topology modulation protein [Oceanobacillus profundus]|uniref:DNA topology modulation protein n=1 Tax=Oceanobacillus profundus TaxID=372463 RepID=A0A417YLR7_9BACI|nr:DNA topology modulation protein [Oceanobacillus profundus]MDO6450294.1 DNA topology modulation protein [Oceanobacillus profundus]RHW34312.1 DNA topology modulation protein [Oceanobacillus profundus]
MKKIMVIGVSAGVGKSTFAQKLGKELHIKVNHLDALYWKPNWVEATLEEFSEAQQEIVKQGQWIIEGNYSNTIQIRAKHADTIIYLELPLYVCLYRVVKRWLKNIGKTRPDMGNGCKEKLDWKFIRFIYTTYYPRKRKMIEQFQNFQALDSTKEIIILKSRQEIKSYLDNCT